MAPKGGLDRSRARTATLQGSADASKLIASMDKHHLWLKFLSPENNSYLAYDSDRVRGSKILENLQTSYVNGPQDQEWPGPLPRAPRPCKDAQMRVS